MNGEDFKKYIGSIEIPPSLAPKASKKVHTLKKGDKVPLSKAEGRAMERMAKSDKALAKKINQTDKKIAKIDTKIFRALNPTWGDWFSFMDQKFGDSKVWKAQKKIIMLTPKLQSADGTWNGLTRRQLQQQVLFLHHVSSGCDPKSFAV